MNVFLTVFILVLCIATVFAAIKGKNEFESFGVVLLDSITFHKVVPNPNYAVVVIVVNKAEIGQYHTDSLRADFLDFAIKGTREGNAADVLFAQVIVNGAQNSALANRIGVESGFQSPRVFLYKAGESTPIQFDRTKPINSIELTRFVSKHTKFFFATPGLIQSFDILAEKFITSDKSEYQNIINESEEAVKILRETDQKYADIYIKVMKRVAERGPSFVTSEITRLNSIIESDKVSDSKKDEIKIRVNIVHQFDRLVFTETATEL